MKFGILFTILFCLNFHCQSFHIYEDKNVKIELKKSSISVNDIKNAIPIIYLVTNKDNNDMIVGQYGFSPDKSIIYDENNKEVDFRRKRLFDGYPAQFEDNECSEIFIKIGKNKTVEIELGLYKFLSFDFDFDETKEYLLRVFSRHNERTATLQGCSKFITEEKKKGSTILDVFIEKMIPLTK